MPTPVAANPPNFDLIYVISDLHLGGAADRQMFASAPQFTAFIEHVLESFAKLRKTKKTARMLLVINGDFVDFLAEAEAAMFNLERSPGMLTGIFDRATFKPVLKGLREYLSVSDTYLVITLGNHDVELALPDTRRTLMQLLSNNNSALEGRIELCFDGWGYRFQLNGKRGLCLHGNESDGYNFTRYDELDRIIRDLQLFGRSEFGAAWKPSAGSWFVINAINPIKQQFPFIDLLKPELPLAATVLGVLDPSKTPYIVEAGQLKATAVKNDLIRPGSQRRMLAASPSEVAAVSADGSMRLSVASLSAEDIEEWTERALADGNIDELIHKPSDAQFLGVEDWIPFHSALRWMKEKSVDLTNRAVATLTGAARNAHLEALRAAIFGLVTDTPYDLGALADADKAIDATVRAGYDVVFAGHTHFRRIAKRSSGNGIYVNTGTWAGLIGLTRSDVTSPRFETIYEALRSNERQKLYAASLVREECTFAKMSSAGNQITVELGGVSGSDGQWTCETIARWPL